MARIAGVNLPTNKRVLIALQYIHGIGPKIAHDIMTKVNLPAERRVSQLTDAEVLQIREIIDRDYMVEGDLRREVAVNIKRLMDLGCYRGLRHRKGLPVRGQRTHTNARTRKGPRKGQAIKRKDTAVNIKRLMDLACYRGLRHRKGLPVRGQRTHTNARTRKGPAKPIAGKKK